MSLPAPPPGRRLRPAPSFGSGTLCLIWGCLSAPYVPALSPKIARGERSSKLRKEKAPLDAGAFLFERNEIVDVIRAELSLRGGCKLHHEPITISLIELLSLNNLFQQIDSCCRVVTFAFEFGDDPILIVDLPLAENHVLLGGPEDQEVWRGPCDESAR